MLASIAEDLIASVVKLGIVPEHIVLIMDGNRRFARQNAIPTSEGHSLGYSKLKEALQWSLRFGVRIVTVYAFSVDNFQRSEDEVQALMKLALQRFSDIILEDGIIRKYGVSVRVLGNLSLLPPELQKAMAKAVQFSRGNSNCILNVCFAYSSTEEISRAIEIVGSGVRKHLLDPSDVDEKLISQCLYTQECPEPEIIIRTSGETRLSDFLLWQAANSYLHFTKVLWPNLSMVHFAWIILCYQREYSRSLTLKQDNNEARSEKRYDEHSTQDQRRAQFISHVRFEYDKYIDHLASLEI